MKITVIIPVYNSQNYISKCIDSVLSQSYQNWEMILIDDGSTDSSPEILNEYKEKDSRISVLSQKNAGAGSARNLGISAIKDEGYVVFIDSDDFIESKYFELLSKHNEDIVFIDVVQKDTEGNVIKDEKISKYRGLSVDNIIRKQMTGYIPWGGVRKAIKTNVLLSHNIKYSSHTVGEEAVFSFKALLYSKTVGFIDCELYNYVVHSDSLSTTKLDDPWGKVVENIEDTTKQLNVYEKYADTINSFYIAATVISIRRLAEYYSYKKYLKVFKERMKILNKQINPKYGIDKKSLGFKIRFVYLLATLNLRTLIYILAKFYK